jgi:asparagine N-glycosylation enzyme membrane subunit Stt3
MQHARLKYLGLWFLFSSIAALACAGFWPAAHLGDEYLPVSNDSFYHARRILDTAADPSAFYEFDSKIHAPEGSLLPWPWGYDYALGWIVRLAGKAGVPGPPMAFLIWIPVAAVFLSVGLMMLVARRLSLSPWSTSIAALCVALSPLTTLIHGAGMIDHHYAEYIFVLATIASGMAWFCNPADDRAALVLGLVLGIAPAIHNGLFILQIPVLATVFLMWLQGTRLPLRATVFFCLALLVATLAILVPSLPFRLGRFEFYTLSWFHLYIAGGTATLAFLLSSLPKSPRNIGLLALVGVALLVPIGRQILIAQSFLAGTITRLNAISEMKSLRRMIIAPGGLGAASSFYTLLIWLAPFTAAYCAFRGWAERNSGRLFFWICSLCGLTMLVMQFRLHYFGSFALYLPLLIGAERIVASRPERRRQIMLLVSMGFLLMYSISIRYFLLGPPPAPAADPAFAKLRPILETLHQACAADPGIVLADNDAGHYIRYYTQCSVIANNFLLTRQHEQKIEQIDYLTSLSAQSLPTAAPYVRYILLRPVSLTRTADNRISYMTFSPKSAQLLDDLLLKPVDEAPSSYVLLNQANVQETAGGDSIPYIRLYKVLHAATAAQPTSSPINVGE